MNCIINRQQSSLNFFALYRIIKNKLKSKIEIKKIILKIF